MSLLTNICSICSQSSSVMEIPHLPRTTNFPASFPSATESFSHCLNWISSSAAIDSCCFSSHLPPTKRKKMPYSLQQPLNPHHPTNLPSYSGYVLPISTLQLFGHYNMKSFPPNVMCFKGFHCADCCYAAFASQTSWDPFFSAQPWKEALILQLLLRVFADSKLQICLILIIAE